MLTAPSGLVWIVPWIKVVILGRVVFNIFISDTHSGTECILSKFADNTKLSAAVDTTEGRDSQRDLSWPEKWAHVSIRIFNKAKLPPGLVQPRICVLGEELFETSPPDCRTWEFWWSKSWT